MGDRSPLGPADVDDTTLAGLVTDQLGTPVSGLISCEVSRVAYDIPAITTAGRWWVRGEAETPGGPVPYAFFVKLVQAWSRSPLFAQVPEEHRAVAASAFPWRTEAAVYRSELAARLPEGLRMPRAHAVRIIDEESYALWLEAVPVAESAGAWTPDRFARAARLLGRLSASPAIDPLTDVAEFALSADLYLRGRLSIQVLPLLRSDIWGHPALGRAFDEGLRARLLSAADRLPALVAELDAMPCRAAHGDACQNNLLVPDDAPDELVLIDFGLWNRLPVGYDLGQLLVGEVQLGRAPARELPDVDATIVPAYLTGLAAEGLEIAPELLDRAHALQLFVFSGVSSLPFELLDTLPPETLDAVAVERAGLSRFSLDLLDRTGG